jgi:hypothetical protein
MKGTPRRLKKKKERDRTGVGVERKINKTKGNIQGSSQDQQRDKMGSCSLLLVVHGVHGVGSIIVGSVADETETTAAAGITVLDDGLEGQRSQIGARSG